jgi:CubicO group peptidase (beta-lactamase class C family)
LRRVTGQDVRTLLRKQIAQPLGWRWMSFVPPMQLLVRIARAFPRED